MTRATHPSSIDGSRAGMTEEEAEGRDRRRNAKRSVIVTGGTRRLGRVISAALAGMGFDIVASYSDRRLSGSAELAAFVSEMEALSGGTCVTHWIDLSDPHGDAIDALIDACPSPAYGLVNNAGVFVWDDLASVTREGIDATLAVNLVAPMLVTSRFVQRVADGDGVVVFVLDQKVVNPYPDHLTYTVSKGAAHMLLKMCALEPGRRVRFYGLAPGLTLPAPGQSEEHFRAAQTSVPLGASPRPEDIAAGVRFLFEVGTANGEVLVIDGGASLVKRERDFEFYESGEG